MTTWTIILFVAGLLVGMGICFSVASAVIAFLTLYDN